VVDRRGDSYSLVDPSEPPPVSRFGRTYVLGLSILCGVFSLSMSPLEQ
jgi:hypothetical protein